MADATAPREFRFTVQIRVHDVEAGREVVEVVTVARAPSDVRRMLERASARVLDEYEAVHPTLFDAEVQRG